MSVASAAECEPSWHAVFEPRTGDSPPSTPVSGSGWSLRLELPGPSHSLSVAEADGVVVLAEGPFVDRERLSARFRASTSQSDAELALAGYGELGDRLLPLLRGSFGLLIWDSVRDRFLCARDPTGSQPLFFARAGERVAVAASQAALLGVTEVDRSLDRVAIAEWVLWGGCRQRRTFYSAVERLPSGHLLRVEGGDLVVTRYWRPAVADDAVDVTPAEALARFNELLDQAVRRCASLGPLGVYLSGGADSAAVASSATVVSRSLGLPNPVALSYVFPHPDANEERTQRAVASAFGMPQYIVGLDDALEQEGLLIRGLRVSERCPLPPVNPWQAVYEHLTAEGARLGCRVIVSGEGGNPWFEAEWYEAADLLLRLKLPELGRFWSEERGQRSHKQLAQNLLWFYGFRPLLREGMLALLARMPAEALYELRRRRIERTIGLSWALPDRALRDAVVADLVADEPLRAQWRFRDWGRRTELESNAYAVWSENLFAAARKVGVRALNPPLDPDLVEFIFSLPRALINLGGETKGLARATVRSRGGSAVAASLGLAWPSEFFACRVRDEAPAALTELAGVQRLDSLGVVDEQPFVRLVQRSGQDVASRYHLIWQTLACEAWLRGHT